MRDRDKMGEGERGMHQIPLLQRIEPCFWLSNPIKNQKHSAIVSISILIIFHTKTKKSQIIQSSTVQFAYLQ